MITLIWAMDENQLIGNGDRLPWHIPEDLEKFREVTRGQTVLMGDATYKSLKRYYKSTPFPFGKIYVANFEKVEYPDAIYITDPVWWLENNSENLFVIGGAAIYKLALPYANRLLITHIKGEYEGDIYFPEFDLSEYVLFEEENKEKFDFKAYLRVAEVK